MYRPERQREIKLRYVQDCIDGVAESPAKAERTRRSEAEDREAVLNEDRRANRRTVGRGELELMYEVVANACRQLGSGPQSKEVELRQLLNGCLGMHPRVKQATVDRVRALYRAMLIRLGKRPG